MHQQISTMPIKRIIWIDFESRKYTDKSDLTVYYIFHQLYEHKCDIK